MEIDPQKIRGGAMIEFVEDKRHQRDALRGAALMEAVRN
jgi:hypothetical protein